MIANREHFRAVGLVARNALHFLGERGAGQAPGGTLSQRDAHCFGIAQPLCAQCPQRGFGRIIESDVEGASHDPNAARFVLLETSNGLDRTCPEHTAEQMSARSVARPSEFQLDIFTISRIID